jgi:hypothetical protein
MNERVWLGLWLCGCTAAGEGPERPDARDPDTGGDTAPDDADDSAEPAPIEVTVCAGAPADFQTVQEGVDGAPDGAVVSLCGETFTGSIVVSGRTLTIRGEEGTVLDGEGSATPLVVNGGAAPTSLRVEGLVITNGQGYVGGGVACTAATVSLEAVEIRANRADEGGGLGATDCDLTMTRVTLADNSSGGPGGGAWVSGGSLRVTRSVISGNVGANGGGLWVSGAAGELKDSEIRANEGHVGGGVWVDGAFALTHNRIEVNVARYTGGGFAAVVGTGAITRNVVRANTCGTDGAGGFTQTWSGDVRDNEFRANVSADDAGGLRMLYGAALIQGNTFLSNLAAGAGGAVKVSHAACEIRENHFEDNAAEEGGALEVDDDVSWVVDNTFRRNRASGMGGALHLNEPFWDMTIEGLLFDDNEAGTCGGAIAMDDDERRESPEDWHTVSGSHLVFSGNRAPAGGGVCVLQGELALTNAIFATNAADQEGGGALADGGDLTLTHVTFYGNTASVGTVAVRGGGDARVTDSIAAESAGGVLSNRGGSAVWRYNLYWGGSGAPFDGLADPTGEDGNQHADPRFVDALAGDLRLAPGSPAIDAGDPTVSDADGSRGDLGAFGGPSGSW